MVKEENAINLKENRFNLNKIYTRGEISDDSWTRINMIFSHVKKNCLWEAVYKLNN